MNQLKTFVDVEEISTYSSPPFQKLALFSSAASISLISTLLRCPRERRTHRLKCLLSRWRICPPRQTHLIVTSVWILWDIAHETYKTVPRVVDRKSRKFDLILLVQMQGILCFLNDVCHVEESAVLNGWSRHLLKLMYMYLVNGLVLVCSLI